MSSWKKWESKRRGLARWRGRKEEERKGKKKSILLGSGGGNSNWDRERDLSSARDVSRGTVLFRRTKGLPTRGYTDIEEFVFRPKCRRGRNFGGCFCYERRKRREELNIFFLIRKNFNSNPIFFDRSIT